MKKIFINSILLILITLTLPITYAFKPYESQLATEDHKINLMHQLEKSINSNNLTNTISLIETNKIIDSVYFEFNTDKLKAILNNYKTEVINKTNTYFNNKDYVSVNNLLNTAQKYFESDKNILNLINLNNQMILQENTIEYTGDVEFLSFQTLMAFPDKALNIDNNFSNVYDSEKLTKNEFEALLYELYKNNYVLIDIFDIVNKESITPLKLMLPPNKKPIVLLFDNASYKSNYQNMGEIDKIIIDRNNNLASYTTKKSIQDRIQYNNEFILILENFIKSYPDFSHNNARGVIFLTGENGILGYNTNHKNASYKHESKRVSEIIKKLKSLGWRFGCNNYSYTDDSLKSDLDFAKEISLWNKEIRSIIGETHLYAYPYGNKSNNITQQNLLTSNNFKIFFEASQHPDIKFFSDLCSINYRTINGHTLRTEQDKLSHLFDCEKIYDHTNRNITFHNSMQT